MKAHFVSQMVFSLALASFPFSAQAGASSIAPTRSEGYAGYNHPNQYLGKATTKIADNLMPLMLNPRQDAEARAKLATLEKKTGKKPNILVFLVDDVGWLDVGFNGGGGAVGNPTPDLDSYAHQGLILTSAYSQPSSSPTRASILTGQYPVHHGLLRPPMYGETGGLAGLISIAQLLRDQGYVTQAIGKWHLGENEASLPQNTGFDDFRGFCSVSDMYTEWRDPAFNPEIALSPDRYAAVEKLPFNKADVHAVRGGQFQNIAEITPKYIEDLDQRWLEYGVAFIKKQAKSAKPFFLYYNTRGAHFDNYPNAFYKGRSPARTTYSDTIVEINDIFAQLMKSLEESGQLENTLVIFTSDNGPEGEVPPYGRTPFRGAKGSTWEGGVRVPTFVYWKGMISPRKSDGLFDLSDIFNTSLSLAGKPGADVASLVPKTTFIDGIDQASFLLTQDGQSNRKAIHYFLNGELSAVRVDEFKVHTIMNIPDAVTSNGYRGGFTGTVVRAAGSTMFNVYTNPQEDDSIAIRHIPAMQFVLGEMFAYKRILAQYPPHRQIGF